MLNYALDSTERVVYIYSLCMFIQTKLFYLMLKYKCTFCGRVLVKNMHKFQGIVYYDNS
jgi:hypothetical protein